MTPEGCGPILLYAGSFDPITKGHEDIIVRAKEFAAKLYVGVGINAEKKYMFTMEQRVAMVKKATEHLPRVEVIEIPGVMAYAAKELHCDALVRGLRNVSDFDHEQQIDALQNTIGLPNRIETIYLMGHHNGISSTAVKELLKLGCTRPDLACLVPVGIIEMLIQYKKENRI